MSKRKALLVHVYVVNYWFLICDKLLRNVPHDDIYVHVSYGSVFSLNYLLAQVYFRFRPKVKAVYFSKNATSAEVKAFQLLRAKIDLAQYSILSYIHAKGVTKPHNSNIKDWVELMRYFLLDRMDICEKAFANGYKLYGINLGAYDDKYPRYGPFSFSEFHFAGNFVSVNLNILRDKITSTQIDDEYFGLEGFWGKLCDIDGVYCPFISPLDLYSHPFPEPLYKNIEINFEK